MADVIEKNDTPIVEKVAAEEVEAKKDKEVVDEVAPAPAAENGKADSASAAKENGDAVVAAESTTETPKEESAEAEAAAPAAEENGKAEEAESEATDSAPAEAVKRKVVEATIKADESTAAVATPEKKAKLDEPVKEDNQNGSEASEVAA